MLANKTVGGNPVFAGTLAPIGERTANNTHFKCSYNLTHKVKESNKSLYSLLPEWRRQHWTE